MKKLFLLILTLTAPAFAEDIYISDTGSGAGTSCADSRPAAWFNISGNWGSGAGKISVGDTVRLCDKISTALTIQGSGTAGNPITIFFEPGAKMSASHWNNGNVDDNDDAAIYASNKSYITIDGNGTGLIEALDNGTNKNNKVQSIGFACYQDCSNITVTGLTVNNMYEREEGADPNPLGNGVAIKDFGHDITVSHCHFSQANAGIYLGYQAGSSNVFIHDNYGEKAGEGDLVIGSGRSGAILTNVNVYGNDFWTNKEWKGYPGIHRNAIHLFAVQNGTRMDGLKVYNNRFSTNDMGNNSTSLLFLEGYIYSPMIYNNLLNLTTNTASGNALLFLKGTDGALVANNTLIGPSGGGGNGLGAGGSFGGGMDKNMVIKNNLFYNIAFPIMSPYDTTTILECDRNVYYAPDPKFTYGSYSQMSFSQWITATGSRFDANSTLSQPMLDSSYVPTGADNAARDRAVSLSSNFSVDKNGVSRPQGAGWDIGAYEYSGPSPIEFYVDPDFMGAGDGSAARPWTRLDTSAQWNVINSTLAFGPVTVYFSAREAGSDTNESSTIELAISRTDNSVNRLTLDGESKYNTNDTAPSWSNYPTRSLDPTGHYYMGSRFQITASIPASTGPLTPRHRYTLRGFDLRATGGQALFHWAGNNVIVEDNIFSGSGTQSNGPGVYFAGPREEGQSGTCTPANGWNCGGYSGLIFRRNYVHDTFGEGVYVAGCADATDCTPNDDILLENNLIDNPGRYGGEADGIDIKTNLTNVVVRGNMFTSSVGETRTCIETLSGGLFEKNFGVDCGALGISLTDFWNAWGTTRPGTIIRNNIFVNVGGNTTYGDRGAIYAWCQEPAGDNFTGLAIYNNTIVDPVHQGIHIGSRCPGALVKNNIVLNSGDVPGDFDTGVLASHDYNLYYKNNGTVARYGGSLYTSATIRNFEVNSLSADPLLIKTASPYLDSNFKLQTNSPAIDKGLSLPSFSVDYAGALRPQGNAWDMGAYEFGSGSTNPLPGNPNTPGLLPNASFSNFKNAFNPTKDAPLTIQYSASGDDAILTVYDRKGNEVKALDHGSNIGNVYTTTWDGRNRSGSVVSSGIYIIVLKQGGVIDKKKVAVVK